MKPSAPSTDLEAAVAEFLAMGRRLHTGRPLVGRQVLETLASWYSDTRVTGAAVDEGNDMLLLQWGTTRPLNFSAPTDLRKLGDGQVRSLPQETKYLDFTRQVFAPATEEDEFDDMAVQMSITLFYGPAEGGEPQSNLWIASPEELAAGMKAFLQVPYVGSLMDRPAQADSITVDHCG